MLLWEWVLIGRENKLFLLLPGWVLIKGITFFTIRFWCHLRAIEGNLVVGVVKLKLDIVQGFS